MAEAKAKRFRGMLEKERTLGWTVVRVPFAPGTVWAEMVRLRVRGTVNGVALRSSLFADEGGYFLMVNRATLPNAPQRLGEMVDVELEPDMEARPAELPDQLAVLLDEEPGLRAWYDGLSEAWRRELGKWVLGVKSAASQARRAQQAAERLLSAMEAERELPPLIARAFRARPKAKAGWEQMTATQRRQELLGVFYYQTPEAQQRRVGKLVDAAEQRGER